MRTTQLSFPTVTPTNASAREVNCNAIRYINSHFTNFHLLTEDEDESGITALSKVFNPLEFGMQ